MDITRIFAHNFDFSSHEYEPKSTPLALNVILLLIAITLSVMSVVRFSTGNQTQGSINLTFSIFSIIGLLWPKKNKTSIAVISYTLCISGLLVISAGVINVPEETLRLGWYLVLLVTTFFLCGWSFGLLMSLFSLLTICTVHLNTSTGYSNYDILYYANMVVVVTVFLSFYEYRSRKNRMRLQQLNTELEEKIKERTAELTKANSELKLFYHALDTSLDSVIVTNLEGVINYCNTTAHLFSGFDKNELCGLHFDQLCADKNFVAEEIFPSLKESDHWENEFQAVRKDASSFPAFASITIIYDTSATPLGVLYILRDLTEIRLAEEKRIALERKLYQSSKMEAIGLMASGVAHDLNNILSGIVGYPEFVLNNLPKESTSRKYIQDIQDAGKRAAAVASDLLTVARGVASTKKNSNINLLIQEYLNSTEYSQLKTFHPDVSYRLQIDNNLKNMTCSQMHISKCIMNLVTNASEAIVGQGTVTISTHNQTVDEPKAGQLNLKPGNYVLLQIHDTGSGIAENEMAHIFEPFYTKKVMGRSGSGLGLAIVWSTMEDHGGKIFVESSEKGTCFKLYFPANEETLVTSKGIEDSRLFRGNGEHILIVDDEDILQILGTNILTSLGYTVHTLGSGEEAVSYLKNHTVDLVLLDMLMEPGMNGLETYEKILQDHPHQKTIIISAYSNNENVKRTLQLGANSFLRKPYDIAKLSKTVSDVLALDS